MFFFFHETIAYLKGNSKIKEKFFQENSYTNKKNVFFGPKIGGLLIHGIDLYTGKYGTFELFCYSLPKLFVRAEGKMFIFNGTVFPVFNRTCLFLSCLMWRKELMDCE